MTRQKTRVGEMKILGLQAAFNIQPGLIRPSTTNPSHRDVQIHCRRCHSCCRSSIFTC
jgi:hypothetical protein